MTTMLAARAHPGEQFFRLEQVDIPAPAAHEVVVRVRAASVTRGLLALWYFTPYIELPSTLGHEAAGEVAAVGPGVTGLREGQRVLVHSALTCGICRACLAGDDTLCENLSVMGYGLYGEGGRDRYRRYKDGGLAEYMLVPALNVSLLPDSVSFDVAAKIGTIAGSLGALRATCPQAGDSLAVVAATGAAGTAAVLCAPLLGLDPVIAVSRTPDSLRRTAQVTGDHLVSVATSELDADWTERGKLTQRLQQLSGDGGLDAVVDFMPLGLDETVQAIEALRPGGRAVLVGGNQVRLPLAYGQLMRNQWSVRGFRGTPRAAEREVLQHIAAGTIDPTPLITHRYPLRDVNDAVRRVHNREDSPLFVVINP
ncbi:MAG: alcohol dehydrogenase catalytic domain-containing protein [Candidatus Dormibacteraeota bacterium]|nr:alcohol dehydrogenase catalytic domain-containing protein [Candidatus Dormibacteraeota bacterium]MBV9525185.1 alcohol dehydrogenase catalytic domain-containing protein [Candidatus Dormibacteraeota bacterium]